MCSTKFNLKFFSVISALLITVSGAISATPLFDSGIPASWNCTGNCGASGANGVVSLAPGGGSQYGWVSTSQGVSGQGLSGIGGTTGSVLRSVLFSANASDNLQFQFNYVTSDGSGYADYAWARLLDAASNQIAILFTARTKPSGTIVPGDGMPLPTATLTPPSVPIIPGAPVWSPLGSSSGTCYASGCGYTGWIQSDYAIAAAGNYYLEFGAVNWSDTIYQSGLAFDGVTVGGVIIGGGGSIPEPATLMLMGLGLAGMGMARRHKV